MSVFLNNDENNENNKGGQNKINIEDIKDTENMDEMDEISDTEDIDSKKEKVIISYNNMGLINMGNSCYFNTAIQCLLNIYELSNYFTSGDYEKEINDRINIEFKKTPHDRKSVISILITREYGRLVKNLWNCNRPVKPLTLYASIIKVDDRFHAFQQEDSQEFLLYLMDMLHEGLNYKVDFLPNGNIDNETDKLMNDSINDWSKLLSNKYSVVVDIFFGQFYIKTISEDISHNYKKTISTKYEIFNMLNIELTGPTLNECLNNFFNNEIMETPYFLENEKIHIKASREFKIIRAPQYLIIVLKRFNNSGMICTKKINSIDIPIINLNMAQYCIGYDSEICYYSLKSIGIHIGNLNSGHYYAFCKDNNENWYEYNDDRQKHINNISIYSQFINQNAYYLIYEKNE